jgi:soluble cytochrome b562
MKKSVVLVLCVFMVVNCMSLSVFAKADIDSLEFLKSIAQAHIFCNFTIAESFVDDMNKTISSANDIPNEYQKELLIELANIADEGRKLLSEMQEDEKPYRTSAVYAGFYNYFDSFIYNANQSLSYMESGNLDDSSAAITKAYEQIQLMKQEMERVKNTRPIWVYLDDQELMFPDVAPCIYNDRTMVPLRAIFEAFGANVDWNSDTQTVSASLDTTTIKVTVDSSIAYKNGTKIDLDAD